MVKRSKSGGDITDTTDSERPTTTIDTTTTNDILNDAFIENEDEDEIGYVPNADDNNEIFGEFQGGSKRRVKKRRSRKDSKRSRKTSKRRVKKSKKSKRYYGEQPALSPSSNYTNRLTDTYRIN